MNYTTKVRKFKKFDIFPNATFELARIIRKQNKNRSGMNGCLSWSCSVCNSRAELLEFGREIDEMKKKFY